MRNQYLLSALLLLTTLASTNMAQADQINAPVIKSGLTCRYDIIDGFSGVKTGERTDTYTVMSNGTIRYKQGDVHFVLDKDLNQITKTGEIHRYYKWPFTSGDSWTITFQNTAGSSFTGTVSEIGIEQLDGATVAHTRWEWSYKNVYTTRDSWLDISSGCMTKEVKTSRFRGKPSTTILKLTSQQG